MPVGAHVDARQRRSPRSSSNGIAADAQTATLWDMANTAPYFCDGSVDDLETCVRQHIAELQVAGRPQSAGCGVTTTANSALAQIPRRLHPTYRSVTAIPKPRELNEDEMSDLLAFLGSLSVRR